MPSELPADHTVDDEGIKQQRQQLQQHEQYQPNQYADVSIHKNNYQYRKLSDDVIGGNGCYNEDYGYSHSSQQEPSFTQMTNEVLTQNADWSQLGEDDDSRGIFRSQVEEECTPKQSCYSPPPPKPWGRLMPCSSTSGQMLQLFPRSPSYKGNCSNTVNMNISQDYNPLISVEHPTAFLMNIQPEDLFNVYWIGRSAKCDVQASNPSILLPASRTSSISSTVDKKIRARQEWCYGMISNRHCKIYCTLDALALCDDAGNDNCTTADYVTSKLSSMQVWIEDCSGNGTTINGTTLLLKGDKRLLHSGDEICLVQKQTLQKKVVSHTELQSLLNEYSFVFVNCVNNEAATTATPVEHVPVPYSSLTTSSLANHFAPDSDHSNRAKRKAAVDVRATKSTRVRYSHEPQQLPNSFVNDGAGMISQQPKQRNSISFDISSNLNTTTSAALQQLPQNRRISPRRQLQRRIQQDYDIRDVLGSGTMGEVRRAINRRTGQSVAVKIIPLKRQRSNMTTGMEIEMEAAILRKLQHPYIVHLMDVYTGPTAVYLVMELVHGGDLFDRIVKKGHYSEVEARRVMRRLLAAVHYLHESSGYGIVHRDLKPENIMLSSTKSDIEVKLTDFGLAKQDGDLKTFCGTPQYFAPEVLRRRHTLKGNGRYGKQADMWSIGVILYVLLTGTPPFDTDDNTNIHLSSQSNGESRCLDFPHHVSPAAQDMVHQLLQYDPKKRASILSACTHQWILQDDGDTHIHPLEDPKLKGSVVYGTRNSEQSNLGFILPLHSDSIKKTQTISPLLSFKKPCTLDSPPISNDSPILLDTEKTKKVSSSAENFTFQKDFYHAKSICTSNISDKENENHPFPRLPLVGTTPIFQQDNHPITLSNKNNFQHRHGPSAQVTPATELNTCVTSVNGPAQINIGNSCTTTYAVGNNGIDDCRDEITSKFSENTESVGSFSTVNTYEMALQAANGLKAMNKAIKINRVGDGNPSTEKRSLLSRRPRKRSLCNASPPYAKRKTATTSSTKKTNKKSSRLHHHDQQILLEPISISTTSSDVSHMKKNGTSMCGVGNGAGGGKQMTLNNWFKKHE